MIQKKFKKPYYQNVWEAKFKLPKNVINWKKIYEKKVKNCPDRKIAEFNYKLLLDKVPNGTFLQKWKKDVSEKCVYCGTSEDTEHLLFACHRVKEIWCKIGDSIGTVISWKRLILGYQDASKKCENIERLLSIVLYIVFKNWIMTRNESLDRNHTDLSKFLKAELKAKADIQHFMKEKTVSYNLLEKVIENL